MEKNYFKIGKDFELSKSHISFENKKKYKPIKILIIDVAFYIIIPLLIAVPAGLYLDKRFETRNIFTLILIFFGFLSSIYNLFRLTKKL